MDKRGTVCRRVQIQDLQHTWRSLLHEHKESASTIRLADYLFESPIITVPRALEVLGMSYPGAQRVVTTLLSHGILIPMDEGRYYTKFDPEHVTKDKAVLHYASTYRLTLRRSDDETRGSESTSK